MGASGGMTSQRWTPAVCFLLASVFGKAESVTTSLIQKYTCRTFGSGVLEPFSGLGFYVLSNCSLTLTHFIHNRVECDITIRRGNSGLLVQVEIIVNKVSTVLQKGSIQVEEKSVSLPYDHTYQHIFQYGIYTRLRSSLLPLSITWHSVPGGIDTLWVELEQELSADMTGLCGKHNVTSNEQQLIGESVISDDTCQTRDPASVTNPTPHYNCNQSSSSTCSDGSSGDICSYEESKHIGCAFFKEITRHCGKDSYIWDKWRSVTQCDNPTCPGDLMYEEEGAAFVPSCSNPNPQFSSHDITSSCICPQGEVLNDQSDGFRCMNRSSCPCVFAGRTYLTGDIRNTKCQSCLCEGGKWHCSENFCPTKCQIEGQFVTTFDGKQYAVPGKCTYLALQGLNWTVIIQFSESDASLKKVVLQHFQDLQEFYTFTNSMVTFGDQEITDFHQSDHAQVFWQSSMYVHVETSSDIMIQIQMSPEIQLYLSAPTKHESVITGLCGNSNGDSTDDFTSSSGIIENSAEPFTLSWSVGACAVNIPNTCINTHNEIFADEKCAVLINPSGMFSECHKLLPPDQHHAACIQRTCNCGSSVETCLCVALGSYAKACASLGVLVGDWRKATNCTLSCPKNQEFFYDIRACNRTCLSLSGTDTFCSLNDAPVEGCGCPEGAYLNQESTCTPKADCVCHHHGGVTPPGPAVIEGRQCLCENGKLTCSKDCSCNNGKVCVHCSESPIKTAQKTCDSLSKPLDFNMACESGCYCPHDQYEDHYGNCVSRDNCTCVYSGEVFSAGQHVRTNCKKCICGRGQWDCKDEPCQGTCQVYGNGHYETFDSKWYRFSGHCQYTLVEDYCGSTNGTFSVRVESVPCCDEALTCSRSIVLDLQGKVTLILSDMKVTKRLQQDWTLQENSLYSVDSVGLYIIVTVPSSGITLIWDKHTRLAIKLHENWKSKVCGLCGDFDSSEMNDLQISGSAVASSPMVYGNSWKAPTPPCSDVTADIFPCDHNSYCSAWAQRRCMIIKGDAFKDCHMKVDPNPYYQACLLESCSCEFEGKFLGFCTAVAAYAEACSDQDVCINWRTPDLCPIYCDYYNKPGQSIWHYEACGKMQICGKEHHFTEKLEGCYPRCPMETPYYDVNAEECTTLRKCSCYFNDTIVEPGEAVMINSFECPCENGTITCRYSTPEARSMTELWTMIPIANTSSITSANTSTTTETGLTMSTTFSVPPTAILTTTEKWSGKTSAASSSTSLATSNKTSTWSRIPKINTSTPNPTFTSAATENITSHTSSSTATSSSVETGSPIPTTTSIITAKMTSAATETLSANPTTTSTPTATSTSTTTETWPVMPTTIPTLHMSSTSTTIFTPTTATTPTETWSATSTGIPTSNTTATSASAGTPLTTLSTTSTLTTVETSLFTETWSTIANTISTPTSTAPSGTAGALSSMPTTNFIPTTPASSSTTETLATIPTTPSSSVVMATSAITEQSSTSTTTSLLSAWVKNPKTISIPTTTTTEKWSTVPNSMPTATTTPIIETMPTTAITPTTKTSPNSTKTQSTTTPIQPITSTVTPTETSSTMPTSAKTTKLISATTEKWSSMQTDSYMPTTTDISNSTGKRSVFPVATSTQTSMDTSTSTETLSTVPPTISSPMVSDASNSAETWSATPSSISTQTSTSKTTETWSKMPLFTLTIRASSITTEAWSTIHTTTSSPTTKASLTTSETLPTMTTARPATTGISATTQKKAVFPTSDSTLITPATSSSTATKTWSIVPTTTFIPTTGSTSATSETWSMPTTATTTSIPTWPTTSTSTTTETSSPMPTTTSIPAVTGASTTTEIMSTTSKPTTSATSPATETWATLLPTTTTYSQLTTATLSDSTEAWSEMSTTTSVLMTTSADVSTITESTSNTPVTREKSSTIATTSLLTTSTNRMRATSSLATAASTQPTSVIHTTLLSLSTGSPETQSSTSKVVSTPLPLCECKDLNKKKNWACGEMWTDDCFHKYCMNGKIVLTPLECPAPTIPDCPRGRVTNVSDGCCETWTCDCHCDLYGETHYISFQGVTFDFLDQCTYILVEERSPRHNLTIGVESSNCVPGFQGSCSRDIILRYQNNVATLSIVPQLFKVQATLNNVIIQPPYEEHGLKFETVEHKVIIQLPDIRSFVSLTPYYTLLVSLAMENFDNNTQGQCGVCGGASCIRKGGQIEDETCCDKTAYDWMYEDPQKPACVSAPKEVPCHSEQTSLLTKIPTTCLPSVLCELLDSIVFENCSNYVDLNLQRKNCKFDWCYNPNASCSALEQAAEECKNAGFCVDWRRLTNGTCDVACPDGLVYRECYDKQDDFCSAGLRYSGASLKKSTAGCFCPSNLLRAGKHSNICVPDCSFCKGPTGEPKLPGDVWQSSCYLCTCNNQTYTEECFPKPPEPAPVCGPTAVLVNNSCCGDQICVEKTCHYNQQIYKAGDSWTDPAHPCVSFSCSKEGLQTETKVCPKENCPEEDRIWDDQHCCYTCKKDCAPRVSSINITVENCSTIIQMPVCHGQCAPQQRVVLNVDLVLEQETKCCVEQSSERRSVTLHCSDLTTREYTYKHITRCVCKPCSTI